MSGKRPNGEGSLRRRTYYKNCNGKKVKREIWELTLMVGHVNGKRQYKNFYAKTQREVIEKAEAWKTEIASESTLKNSNTFAYWADIWLEFHKARISVRTQENYLHVLKTLKDKFGETYVKEITPLAVEYALKELVDKGLSNSYIDKCRFILGAVLQKAMNNNAIEKNPVSCVERTGRRNAANTKDAFTEKEVKILMDELPYDLIGNSIRLLLCSGMRTQELLALGPDDIEPDGSGVYVRRAVVMEKGKAVLGPTKTVNSERYIPIPYAMKDFVLSLRQTDSKLIWESPKKPAGCPCSPDYFRAKYKNALDAIPEVRMLTPHCCRHTYVSQMQALGVDLSTIAEILGHNSTRMTSKYLHVQDHVVRSAAELYGRAFAPGKEKCA